MSNEHSAPDIPNLGELRWQCRRGKLELDIALEGYLGRYFAESSKEEQRDFAALLRADDQDIFNWVVHNVRPPSEGFAAIVAKIRRLQS